MHFSPAIPARNNQSFDWFVIGEKENRARHLAMGRPSDRIARNMKRFPQRPPSVPLPRADVSVVSAGTTGKII
jgi:hypothetical protein